MPDNRLTLTIEAQNLAQAAFKQLQADVRQSNDALQKTEQAGRQGSVGIKIVRDELGRFHDVATGRFVSAARALREGFTEVERGADGAAGAAKQANPIIARMRQEFNFLRTDIHNTAAVTRQFSVAIQGQIRSQVDAAANIERLRVGLVSLSGDLSKANRLYGELVEVSRLPGINIENSLRTSLQLQALDKDIDETTEIIREFGNALALSGTPPRELNQVVNAIRQMAGEGKILQEDIAILTTRVAALVPHLKEAFGGTRAEDVRQFFDALGVDESEQADQFLRIVLDRLKELPRAGETASNAIENLQDTTQRVQATIGATFLPLVKETTSGIEGLLKQIERNPEVARNIALLETLGGTFLTVTAAGVGLAAGLPALIAAIGSLGATVLAPVAALGGLAAVFVSLRARSAELREEIETTNSTIERAKTILEAPTRETLTAQLDQIRDRQRAVREEIERLSEDVIDIGRGQTAFVHEDRINALQKSIRETLPIVEQLSRALGQLNKDTNREIRQTQATLQGRISDLTSASTGSVQAIATALQQLDNFGGGRDGNLNNTDKSVRDLALDLGDQLIAIAESTSVKQAEANKKRVDALARDNSLILEDSQQLQALLLAIEEAFIARRRQLRQEETDAVQASNRQASADERLKAETDFSTEFRDIRKQLLEATTQDEIDAAQERINTALAALDQLGIRHEAFNRYLVDLARIRERTITEIEQEERDRAIQGYYSRRIEAEVQFAQEFRDIRGRLLEATTQAEIDALQKEFDATVQSLTERGIAYQAFNRYIQQFPRDRASQEEQILDDQLSHLADRVQLRQALYEDELKAQRQVEDAKQKKVEETHDYASFLLGLRRDSLKEARDEFARLEERALDTSSQRQREHLIRETQQFVDAYAERGEAFRDLVADAQDLGTELQNAFDLTEQQKRLEDFQDGLANVLQDLAGIAIDHIWDSFTDGASRATDAVSTFVDEVRGELSLLQSDITRLIRFDEDQDIRRERLIEDRDRRISQLRRQQQALAARQPVGDQRAIERNVQRQQDLTARITSLREDFAVRLSRFDEDRERRRNRTIEDATLRRERFEARSTDDSLLSKLGDSLASSVSSAISSALASGLAGLISGALSGQFSALTEAIKGLFGGSGETQTTTTTSQASTTDTPASQGEADVDGTINVLSLSEPPPAQPLINVTATINALALSDPPPAAPNINLTGTISALALSDPPPTAPNVDVVGAIKSAVVDAAYTPVTVEVKGLITSVMLAPGLQVPTVSLPGVVNQISVDPAATVPTINPAAVINDITTAANATVPTVNPSGLINDLKVAADATIPTVNPSGVIKSLTTGENAVAPTVNPSGVIKDLSVDPTAQVPSVNPEGVIKDIVLSGDSVIPNVNMTGKVTGVDKSFTEPVEITGDLKADLSKNFTEPVPINTKIEIDAPDLSRIPPLDSYFQPIHVPITFTPDFSGLTEAPETPDNSPVEDGKSEFGASQTGETVGSKSTTQGATTASIVANEERRQKIFGSGNPSVQTNITTEELTKALIEGQRESQEVTRSALHDLPRTIADGIGRLVSFILGSGLIGVGAGDVPGSDEADQINADVAATLRPEDSPRSDFIVTLPPNVYTNQGTRDPDEIGDDDDETAQAPAAVRFGDTGSAVNTAANFLTLDALANVAQESTLTSIANTLEGIKRATEQTAQQPLVDQLIEAGVAFPRTLEDRTNSFIPDVLSQAGISLFAGFDNLQRRLDELGITNPQVDANLVLMEDLAARSQPVDLSQRPGGSSGSPMFIKDVDAGQTQKVEVMNFPQHIHVKQAGAFEVKQAGAFEVTGEIGIRGVVPVDLVGELSASLDISAEELYVRLRDAGVRVEFQGA